MEIFRHSEKTGAIPEEAFIKVENIKGQKNIYPYGTHFLYPEGMMKIMVPVLGDLISRLFVSGRKHPKECKEVRIDVEKKVRKIVVDW